MNQCDQTFDGKLPLVSCICVTDRRISLLQMAIRYFRAQDYPNKELIVSYPETDRLSEYIVNKEIREGGLNISGLARPLHQNLGDARNCAVERSAGQYICTWDDDDWYHPTRIYSQINSIIRSGPDCKANIITRVLFFDRITGKAYISFPYTWENTLLCDKSIFFDNKYKSKHIGEDSNIVDELDAQQRLSHIIDAPFLYIYTYHRGNVWNYTHFKSFYKRSEQLEDDISLDIGRLFP